jgi:hypothetical protein
VPGPAQAIATPVMIFVVAGNSGVAPALGAAALMVPPVKPLLPSETFAISGDIDSKPPICSASEMLRAAVPS